MYQKGNIQNAKIEYCSEKDTEYALKIMNNAYIESMNIRCEFKKIKKINDK